VRFLFFRFHVYHFMKTQAIVIFILLAAFCSAAQDQSLQERGNHGMGFDQQKTTHHFLLTKDGGIIQVSAKSPEDKSSIDQIRMHLEHIAGAFASGDFDIPMFVHDRTPPGVPVLKKLRKKLAYKVELMDSGGRVVIHTADSKALHALWDFLRFQITEHKTGDPLGN
jgi:hypothetical protein